MRRAVIQLVSLLMLSACAQTKDANAPAPAETGVFMADSTVVPLNGLYVLSNYLTTAVPDTGQVEVIDYNCALIVNPTDDQIRAMREEYGEEDFYIVADDNMWYQGNAVAILDSMKIHRVNATKPYVAFYGKEGRWTVNLRKPGALPWNLILFNVARRPEIVSTVDLNPERVRQYFQ